MQAQTPFFPQFNQELNIWVYLDLEGNEVLQVNLPDIEDLQPFSDGLAMAQDEKTHSWGYINTLGKWQIKPIYDYAKPFKQGTAIVYNECKKNCNKSTEGLLSSRIGSIIDKNGKNLFTDNSQDKEPYKRYFLEENLGASLYGVTFGYGYNDMRNLINIKGEFLCETYSIFGSGASIYYDDSLKAYACQNIFYNLKGEKVLDLSGYAYPVVSSEGYIMYLGIGDETDENDEGVQVLLDFNKKEIAIFDNKVYRDARFVENGRILYSNDQFEKFYYNIKTKEISPYIRLDIEDDYHYTISLTLESNGTRFIFSSENNSEIVGFISKSGDMFFKGNE